MEHTHATTEEQKAKLRTSEKIVKAAIRLFKEKEYYDISMDEVIEASGLSKETVYDFFSSKEKLFTQILIREYDKWFAYEQDIIWKMPELSLEEYRGHLLLTTSVMIDVRDMLVRLMSMKKCVLEVNLDEDSIHRVDRFVEIHFNKFAKTTVDKVAGVTEGEIYQIYSTMGSVIVGCYHTEKDGFKKIVVDIMDNYLEGLFSRKEEE